MIPNGSLIPTYNITMMLLKIVINTWSNLQVTTQHLTGLDGGKKLLMQIHY